MVKQATRFALTRPGHKYPHGDRTPGESVKHTGLYGVVECTN